MFKDCFPDASTDPLLQESAPATVSADHSEDKQSGGVAETPEIPAPSRPKTGQTSPEMLADIFSFDKRFIEAIVNRYGEHKLLELAHAMSGDTMSTAYSGIGAPE
eukprot:5832200-Karenia_brevis.AAC.1